MATPAREVLGPYLAPTPVITATAAALSVQSQDDITGYCS